MTTMIYIKNMDMLFSFVTDYNDIIYNILIFLSFISIISLPFIYLSGGFKKLIWDGTKWVSAGAAFGVGEYGAQWGLDQLTGNNGGNNGGNTSGTGGGNTSSGGSSSSGGNTSSGGSSGGGDSSSGGNTSSGGNNSK